MADQKISELTALTGANVADDDAIAIVDTSATETKKIVFSELKNALDTATGFVRITGDTMTGDLSMGDNVKAIFGAGSDLQIYHDGSSGHSIITESGGGALQLQGENLVLEKPDGTNYLLAVSGASGYVKLYQNGSEKLSTTSTGVDITGVLSSNGLTVGDNSTSEIPIYFNSSSTDFSIGANGNNFILAQTTGDLDSNQLLTVTSTGSVGIGTSSPSYKLDVDGEIRIKTNTNGLIMQTSTSSDVNVLRITGGNNVVLRDSTNSDALTIDSSGAVIVNNSGGDAQIYLGGTSGTSRMYLARSGADSLLWNVSNGNMRFGTNDAERMRIDSSGNVGIGTSSPSFESGTGGGLEINNSSGNGAHVKLTDAASGSGGTNGFDLYAFNTSGYIENYEAGSIVFRNNGSEAMRIDSSGNLLVGTTGVNPHNASQDAGVALRSDGRVLVGVDGDIAAAFNRNNSDGDIALFKKDGSTVGSIGIQSTGFYIDGETGHAGIRFAGNEVSPRNSGSDADGTVSLGESDKRFKDLYLSGGVYLGGTGSANKLDDYEEGTFTPSIGSGSGSGGAATGATGNYTKIGNRVFADVFLTISTLGTMSGAFYVTGFPFTSNAGNVLGQGAVRSQGIGGSDNIPVSFEILANTTYGRFHFMSGTSTQRTVQVSDMTASDFFALSISYII